MPHVNPTSPEHTQKRYKLIACEIIYREMCQLIANSPHIIDVEFLRKGLHDAGAQKMSAEIQEQVNACDSGSYDAILLGYARCNDGIVGITAPAIPLVVPRAHDCITLLFGSTEAYQEYSEHSPGTYFRSTGWSERNDAGDDSVMHQLGLDRSYEEYVAKYGPDNAKFIMESIGAWQTNYKYLAYIEMGFPMDDQYAGLAQQEASQRDLEFRRLTGSMALLSKLINGPWGSEEFLLVGPGQTIASDDQGGIVKVL